MFPDLHQSQRKMGEHGIWREQMTGVLVAPTPRRAVNLDNVGNLSVALKNAVAIPDAYVQPEGLRPDVPYDGYSEETDQIPVVDLHNSNTGTVEERQRIISDIGCACKEWGFLQVLNHGVPDRLMQRLTDLGTRFFQMPAAEKEKAAFGQVGYEGRHVYMPERVQWVETLALVTGPDPNLEDILRVTCADYREEFIATVNEYIQEIQRVGLVLLELMAESLALEKSFFSQHFEKNSTSVTRFNYYPPCPLPSVALGLFPHADPNCITILNQDDIGGLQIRKDGRWISVRPLKDTLVVNVGDSLQAWTNGHFKSVEHRAVLNSVKPRLSVVFFYSPYAQAAMAPPLKLVDECHPLLYRPFTWAEYFPRMQKKRMEGKVGIDTFMRLDHKEDSPT
ncbi:hypothetical protein O6H91_11G114200 [Diphasiastrum complanatum]|uniref:Uncharacterized protein n=1 Tax=Diphasiastrum complanatum TaxID=34168 RepID=A0ACC2CCZ1_DIPCM|nr:hypothetical protein O6H91_11G114200 [Diphasiastrum complanatum]